MIYLKNTVSESSPLYTLVVFMNDYINQDQKCFLFAKLPYNNGMFLHQNIERIINHREL